MYTFFLFLTAEIQCYKTGIELFLYNPQETRSKKKLSVHFIFYLHLFHLLCPCKDKGVPGKTG